MEEYNYYRVKIWNDDGTFNAEGRFFTKNEALELADQWAGKENTHVSVHHFVSEAIKYV